MLDEDAKMFRCRFHPSEGFHEIGCPHQEWTKEALLEAILVKKRFEEKHLNISNLPEGEILE